MGKTHKYASKGCRIKDNIGFIGLGKMGMPMAIRLAESGFSLCAYDIRHECEREVTKHGIAWMPSIKQLVENSQIILIIVYNGDQVRKLMLDPGGILEAAKTGTVVIDMTSSDPMLAKELLKSCNEKGIQLIDAPVSGGVAGAKSGTLAIMAGGEELLVEKYQNIFQVLGKKCVYIGPNGSGYAVKCMNNYLSALAIAGTAEVVALANKAGMSAEKVVEFLAIGSGTSDAVTRKYPQNIFPDIDAGYTMETLHKDLKNYVNYSELMKMPTIISSVVYQLWNIHVIEGRGKKDGNYFVEPYERWCGKRIRGINTKGKKKGS